MQGESLLPARPRTRASKRVLASLFCGVTAWTVCAAPALAQNPAPADLSELKRLGVRPVEPLSAADQQAANALFPQSYGVFVGINSFEDSSIVRLECAKNDATELYKLFVEEMQFIPKENARLLVSGGKRNNATESVFGLYPKRLAAPPDSVA
jgi:hypothetical protein